MEFTLAKNATRPDPVEIISLQITRKENNWKTEETLARTVVTLETERIKLVQPLMYMMMTGPFKLPYSGLSMFPPGGAKNVDSFGVEA